MDKIGRMVKYFTFPTTFNVFYVWKVLVAHLNYDGANAMDGIQTKYNS